MRTLVSAYVLALALGGALLLASGDLFLAGWLFLMVAGMATAAALVLRRPVRRPGPAGGPWLGTPRDRGASPGR